MVQSDIKRVLAFSTVSQLGYMMLAMGIGSWVGGLFHLITHAFFKSLLFLAAGSVILAAGHEQEMPRMRRAVAQDPLDGGLLWDRGAGHRGHAALSRLLQQGDDSAATPVRSPR